MTDERKRLEEEGIPAEEGPLPQKDRTGDPQEGRIPPAGERQAALTRDRSTALEHREGASLDERLAEEQGDRDEISRTREEPGQIVEDRGGRGDEAGDAAGDPALANDPEERAVRVEGEEAAPGLSDEVSDRYVEEP